MVHTILPHEHGVSRENERFCEKLGQGERFVRVAELFKLLSDPTRIRIFWLLCHTEQCVVNLSAMLGMSEPAISHHLRLMKESGLLVSRRDGKEVYYQSADSEESALLHKMTERVMQIACPEEGSDGITEKIHAVHDWLLENLDRKVTAQELAKRFYMNPTTIRSAFKAVYGDTPTEHMREHRMKEAARLLRESEMSIAEAARAVGYDSQSKFAVTFKQVMGILPSEYKNQL